MPPDTIPDGMGRHSTGTARLQPKTYHTDADCYIFQRISQTRLVAVGSLDDRWQECDWCRGAVDPAERTHDIYTAAVEADPGEVFDDD